MGIAASAARLFDKDKRPIILYDGVCNLCNGGVNLVSYSSWMSVNAREIKSSSHQMLDWDLPKEANGSFRFASLQSEVGKVRPRRALELTYARKPHVIPRSWPLVSSAALRHRPRAQQVKPRSALPVTGSRLPASAGSTASVRQLHHRLHRDATAAGGAAVGRAGRGRPVLHRACHARRVRLRAPLPGPPSRLTRRLFAHSTG